MGEDNNIIIVVNEVLIFEVNSVVKELGDFSDMEGWGIIFFFFCFVW